MIGKSYLKMQVLKFWCAGALMAHRTSAMQYSKLSAHIMSVLLASHKFGIRRNSENELNMFQILLYVVFFFLF